MSLLPLSHSVSARVAHFRRRVWLGVGIVSCLVPATRAQEIGALQSLYSFGSSGSFPVARLAAGGDGNFYGATSNGGDANGDGTVYQVSPAGGLTALYSFGGGDGSQPYAGLLQGADGNFYGTTSGGGDANGDGTVFRISRTGAFATLYAFAGADGSQPQSELAQGADGNFYGTTTYGGANGDGTVYRLTPAGALTTLYSFTGGSDGAYPSAGLVQGSDGSFYGATSDGGSANGDGTIYRITPAGTLATIYTFNGADGYQPVGGLVQGTDGNFYGTTVNGGANGYGTVFQLAPAGTLTTLYSFAGSVDGAYPYSGLIQGGDGNFYGATSAGGDADGDGTLYQITPAGALTTLYTFSGSDGSQPQSTLVQGGDGSFYGTTSGGGAGGAGTVFKLVVAPAPSSFFAGEVPLGEGAYYLALASGNPFGYYSFLSDPRYVFHFDFGCVYVFDAADGSNGVYLYDFASSGFFYTSPTFPFPYLYDFGSNSVVYYYPDPNNAGRYTTDPRCFYDFSTGQIITK